MKPIRSFMERIHPLFESGRPLERLYPAYEAMDGFLYSFGGVSRGPSHVRDSIDLKRVMILVVVALLPCCFMACYNTGWQALSLIERYGLNPAEGWRMGLWNLTGLPLQKQSFSASFVWGALYFLPLYLCSFLVGAFWELLFAVLRRKEVNEGFLVTSLLFPLTLPPTLPLWQAALGISFGIVVGKEIFGGTGRNFMNPALVGRVFLFFAYPAQLSGDQVWLALPSDCLLKLRGIDGFSGATALSIAASKGLAGMVAMGLSWGDFFVGMVPGSLGEGSKLASLGGALFLLFTGLASWHIIAGIWVGAMSLASLLYVWGGTSIPILTLPPHWQFVLGSLVFGSVFMATDPVSAAMSRLGRWLYGLLIGCMIIVVRAFNPAFPEGVMLSILFGNACAPLFDYLALRLSQRRRRLRRTT